MRHLECKVPVYNGNELIGYETVNIEPSFNGTNYGFTLLGITAKMMNDENRYYSGGGSDAPFRNL